MPNIEAHGYGHDEFHDLLNRFVEAFQGRPYEGEIVVTKVASRTHTLDGKNASKFLRVYDTPDGFKSHWADMKLRLPHDVDVEAVRLEAFVPAS